MLRKGYSSFQITGLLLSILFALFLLIYTQCSNDSAKEEPGSDISGLYFLNHNNTVSYVGIKTCAGCHLDKVNSFLHTGMGQSFDFATPGKSAAKFGTDAHVYDSFLDLHYRAFWRDSVLFVSEYRLDDNQIKTHYREQRIDYIIGSGQHTNSHLFKEGKYIYQAPMTWYSQEKKWDLPPGFENGANSRFSRQVDVECISCHNAMPVMESGSGRAFISIGNGIDCERCHGPGELHVQYRLSGGVNNGKIDSTIVNPSKLPAKLQIDLCQRCHLQGNNVLKSGRSFVDFKPGMELKDFFEVYSPEYQGNKDLFNMADHSQRLQMSRCYISTENTARQITCITCHDPHISVKMTGKGVFNKVCQNCHNRSTEVCTESQENRARSDDNCVSCHMPLSGAKDIPHVRVHDHRISIPDTTKSTKPRRLTGLYAVNNNSPELAAKIQAYLTYYEKFSQNEFYLIEAEKMLRMVDEPALNIHLEYLKNNWKKILEIAAHLSPEDCDAMTNYRIGKAGSKRDNYVKAMVHYEHAIDLQPDINEFYNDLGVAQIKMGYLKEATLTYDEGLKRFPNDGSLLSNAGYVHYLAGNRAKSLQFYLRSVNLNPDHLPTLKNLAQWYLSGNDGSEARKYLNRILILEPGNTDARKILKELDSSGQIR